MEIKIEEKSKSKLTRNGNSSDWNCMMRYCRTLIAMLPPAIDIDYQSLHHLNESNVTNSANFCQLIKWSHFIKWANQILSIEPNTWYKLIEISVIHWENQMLSMRWFESHSLVESLELENMTCFFASAGFDTFHRIFPFSVSTVWCWEIIIVSIVFNNQYITKINILRKISHIGMKEMARIPKIFIEHMN